MIISEIVIKVPCRRYKIKVSCLATRRLTTIEWILMTCIKKFGKNSELSEEPLTYALEEVLKIQNSEFLIKPCMDSLKKLGVLVIDEKDNTSYTNLKFSQVYLSTKGIEMLDEGLLPGESREVAVDVYYNPLTGTMNSYEPQKMPSKEVTEFGNNIDLDVEFPKEIIVKGLQDGKVDGQRFTASKYKIDGIELLEDDGWENQFMILVGIDDRHELYTEPKIVVNNMIGHIRQLLMVQGIDEKMLADLNPISKTQIKTVIGTGAKVKEAILEVCKNGRIIFIDDKIYKSYKKNMTAFKGKTIIIFNSDKFFIEKEDATIIKIPFAFSVAECVVINEKNEHVNLCLGEYIYENQKCTSPLAFSNPELFLRDNTVRKWIHIIVNQKYKENIQYLTLLKLPFAGENESLIAKYLLLYWAESEKLNKIVSDLNNLNSHCLILTERSLDMLQISEMLMGKIDFRSMESTIKDVSELMNCEAIKQSSNNYVVYAKEILKKCYEPQSYIDMLSLYHAIGISTHDDALKFDDEISTLYNYNVIKDVIANIMQGKYRGLPEFFEYDLFFNELHSSMLSISMLLNQCDLFSTTDDDKWKLALMNCPDIGELDSYIAQLRAKEANMASQNMNLFTIMEQCDKDRSKIYFNNLRFIEKHLDKEISTSVTELSKVYILDTCALMHQPNIFDYFLLDDMIRIPTKVIDELGKIKDGRSYRYDYATSNMAREMSRKIEKCLKLMNKENKARFLIENASVNLLPIDLDPTVPDNQILSVALKYADKKPVIISDDGVFRIASVSQNLETINSEDFIISRADIKKKVEFGSLESKPEAMNTNEYKPTSIAQLVLAQTFTKDEAELKDLAVDDLPISILSKYNPTLTVQVIAYLQENRIKTIRDFRKLSESRVRGFAGKAKQNVYKNGICSALKRLDETLDQVKL